MNRALVASLALASGLALAGCAPESEPSSTATPPQFGDDENTATSPPGETETPSESDSPDEAGTSLDAITQQALDAIALAESHAGGTAYELDDEDDESAWKIDVAVDGRSVEVEVNWAGTEVLSTENDDELDADDREDLTQVSYSMSNAIVTAAAEVSGHVVSVDLSSDDGVIAWEVEFENGNDDVEVYVDAATGDVLRVERD